MASQLTSIAVTARKSIRYGIYLVIFLIVGRFVLGLIINIYRAAVPPRSAPPTVGFDVLPKIEFPAKTIELPQLKYTVETASGLLPEFPEQMRVYAIPKQTANLFSFEQMKEKAKTFGFTSEPIQISERIYRFNHPSVPSTMEADIVSGSFSISFNLAADSSPLQTRSRTVAAAEDLVAERLNDAKLLADDLNGPIEHIFLKVEGQNLVRALSLSDAQLVQVNLFRKNLGDQEEYPMVTGNPNKANVWFIVSGDPDENKQIIAGEYKYFPVDQDLVETYPIKSAEDSLQELVRGNGYIANLGLNLDGNVTIRKIYLAYYDPDINSGFLQPVVVFEGDDDFLAYVPAVTNEFIERQN